MPHILVVCTANICRSPVAEVILRHRLPGWTVSSAGTWAQRERPAARFSRELMAEIGFDLSQHRARMITETDLAQADLVLCMTSGHAEALRAEFPQHSAKIYQITEMVGHRYDVADPYGGAREEYEQMVREVTHLIDAGLPRIRELAGCNEMGV